MTYTEDDVERVARAICNAHRTWAGRSVNRQREIVDEAWQSHVAEARAALDAMSCMRNAIIEKCANVVEDWETRDKIRSLK